MNISCPITSNGNSSLLFERLEAISSNEEAQQMYQAIFTKEFEDRLGFNWKRYNELKRKKELTSVEETELKLIQRLDPEDKLDKNGEPRYEVLIEALGMTPEDVSIKRILDKEQQYKNEGKFKGATGYIEESISNQSGSGLLKFDDEQYIQNEVLRKIDDEFANLTGKERLDKMNEIEKDLREQLRIWKGMSEIGNNFHDLNRLIAEDPSIRTVDDVLRKAPSGLIPPISRDALQRYSDQIIRLLDDLRSRGKVLTEQDTYFKGDVNIRGIQDLILILPDGTAEIWDYKFAIKDFTKWNNQKQKQIEYQMTMYKNILRSYGIPVRSTNIVPIEVSGGLEGTSINNLRIDPVMQLEMVSEDMKPSGRVSRIVSDHIPVTSTTSIQNVDRRGTESIKQTMSDLYGIDLSDSDGSMSEEEFIASTYRKYDDKGTVKHYVADRTNVFQDSKGGRLYLEESLLNNEEALQDKLSELYLQYLESAGTKAEEMHRYIQNLKQAKEEGSEKEPAYRIDGTNTSTKNMKNALAEYTKEGWELMVGGEDLMALGVLPLIKMQDGIEVIDFVVKVEDRIDHLYEGEGTPFKRNRRLLTAPIFKDSIVRQNMLKHNIPKATNGNLSALRAMMWIAENQDFFNSTTKVGKIKLVSEREPWKVAPFESLQESLKVMKESLPESIQNGVSINYGSNTEVEYLKTINELIEEALSEAARGKMSKYKDNILKYIKASEEDIEAKESLIEDLKEQQAYLLEAKKRSDNRYNAKQHQVISKMLTELEGIRSEPMQDLVKYGTIVGQNVMTSHPYEFQQAYVQAVHEIVKVTMFDVQQQLRQYVNEVRPDFEDFFRLSNYGGIERHLVGDMDAVFEDMIEIKDTDGNHVMRIKPLDQLEAHQRKLATKLLEQLMEIKLGRNASTEDKINHRNSPEYRDLPLLPSSFAKRVGKMNALSATKATFKEFIQYEKIMSLNPSGRGADSDRLSIGNGMLRTLKTDRKSLLNSSNAGEYSTNLQLIMYAFMSQQARADQFSKRIPQIDAIRQSILYTSVSSNIALENLQEYINSLVDTAVFNKLEINTESKASENLERLVHANGKLASIGSIGLSIQSGLSQMFQGIFANVSEALVNMVGDDGPSVKDLVKANMYVLGNESLDVSRIGLMDDLNETYQIGNFDSQYAAQKMAERKGIMNFGSKWLYWLNNAPDHYNRMSYFVARMMKEGSWEAHERKGDTTVYNENKDKRFIQYLSGNKNHPDYEQQKALYQFLLERLSKVEGGTRMEGDKRVLNMAYTPEQSATFKTEADRLHGFYNHEDKINLAKTVFGRLFMQFKTWVRAKLNRYYQDTILSSKAVGEFQFVKDENGELKAVWQGRMMEGIFQTLSFMYHELSEAKEGTTLWTRFMGLNDTLRTEQKKNLARLSIDLSLIASLWVLKDILDEWVGKDRGSIKDQFSRSLQFALKDFNVFATTVDLTKDFSLPSIGFSMRLADSLFKTITLQKDPQELLKSFGATRQIYYLTLQNEDNSRQFGGGEFSGAGITSNY